MLTRVTLLHFNGGVKLIDLFPKAVPELSTFGFEGGRQKTVLNREHLSVQSDVLHLMERW